MSLRLERFELRAFGPFTGTELELAGAPGSLHLITGPNEIGKSTAQRAIGDFLFGIPARSSDNQLHEYVDMRLAAELLDGDGARHELVRRKGTRSTLLGPDGTAVDDGVLESMLGGLTREAFMAMFSITHESLLIGGRELLAAGGEVGESLFSASLGASALHRVRESLDGEAAKLFKPRASSSLIMQARARLEAAELQLRETTLRATTFLENERLLKAVSAERDAQADELAAARARQNGRRRTRSLVPLLAERDAIMTELESLSDVPALAADAAERRVRAAERARTDEAAVEDAVARIAALDARIGALSDSAVLLEREIVIKALMDRRTGIREGREVLERQSAAREVAQAVATRLLADVRPDAKLSEADDLLLDSRRRGRVHRALDDHAGLRAKLGEALRAAGDAQRRADELQAEVTRSGEVVDTEALELAVSLARDEGPLEEHLADAEAERQQAEDGLGFALAGLRPQVDLDKLAHQPVPSASSIDRFGAEQERLDERAATLADRRAHLEAERHQLAADRARMALGTDVPTGEELDFLRSRRDRDWARIRQRLEGHDDVEVSPENFERGIRLADEHADRLREHAGLAAQAAELDLRAERLAAEFGALHRADEQLSADQAAWLDGWREIWSAAAVTPLSPREMTEWLRDRGTVIERALSQRKWVRSVLNLRARRDQHRRALSAALAVTGVVSAPETPLSQLVSVAQATIETATARRSAAADLERELAAAQSVAARQQAAAAEFERELALWQADWNALLIEIGWPADVVADDARHILATLEDLATALKEISVLGAEVAALRTRIDAFDREAAELIAELAPELATWALLDGVAELGRRLESAIEQRSRRCELMSERESAVEERAQRLRGLNEARSDLSALLSSARVADVEALMAVEERSARKAHLSARLPELEDRLVQVGQAPLEEIVAQAVGVDIDVLDAESQAGEADLARLEGELRVLDERRGELASERQVMERAGGAAEAGQAVEERLAELRELVERYLRVYVAAWALREAIDRYRREHKDPLLRRASELFPRLTCGSFTALEADFDETDEPVLIGVRASGERVRVEQMSTGTREQLYLSLRLASLERHVELHGPMPVILDDVVLHSDPRRKTAILTALAELGRVTQVICFSHDPAVVALAQRSLDPALITVHELGAREIPDALHPVVGTREVRPIRRPEAA